MNACERFRTLVSDSLAGVDLPESDGPYRAHVGACEDCESWAQTVYWQDRVLAEMAGEARLDVLLGRVRATILNTAPAVVAAETPPPLRIRRPRTAWPRRLGAAAAVAALAIAVWLLAPRRPETPVVVRPEVDKPAGTPAVKDVDPPIPVPPEDFQPSRNSQSPPAPPPPVLPAKSEATAKTERPPAPKPPDVAEPPKDKVVKARPKADQVGPAIPPPIDLVERTAEQAIKLGVTYLKGKCDGLDNLKSHRELRSTELVLWTMAHAGVSPADPDFQRLLKTVLERKLEQTYTVALQAMLLEELDRVTYQWRIHQCAQFLVDNQNRAGLWGYGAPSIFVEDIATGAKAPSIRRPAADLDAAGKPKVKARVEVKKKRESAEGGDHSNSMYAALGLRACFDAGVRIPVAVAELAQKAWRDGQIKVDGGWCYGRHEASAHKAYGSMTSGGVGSLVIYDYILGKDWKKDRDIQEGLGWLAKNFSVTWNPGQHEHAKAENSGHHLYYYLYALERAAILYGTEQIGKKDWYAEGSKSLLGAQRPDGAWLAKEGGQEVYDTCFAVLFLTKATRSLLLDVPTGVRK
ncbi:MAG TPA: hypothetical protein VF950_21680 [Planctomycetota bacterium]